MQRRSGTLITLGMVGVLAVLVTTTIAVMARISASAQNSKSASTASSASNIQPATYQGTDLGSTPAPDFTLVDQNGQKVSLSQFKGHPVFFTFFDSVCPHADCSLMAEYMNATVKALGPQAANVDWVAVSLNPWHDTPQSASSFLKVHQVTVPMRYMLGSPDQLTSVWKNYHMQAIEQPNGIVIHTTGVYLLDSQLRERVYLDEGFDPNVAASDLRLLLTEPDTAKLPSGASSQASKGQVLQAQTLADGSMVALTATPGSFGTYTFTASLEDKTGIPIQNATVTANLNMPDMVMEPVNITLKPLTPPIPGAYQSQGVVSMVGQWTAKVTVTLPGTSTPMTTTFNFTAQFA